MADNNDTSHSSKKLADLTTPRGDRLLMFPAKDGTTPIMESTRRVRPTYSLEMETFVDEYLDAYETLNMAGPYESETFTTGFITSAQARITKFNGTIDKEDRWPKYGKRELEPFVLSKILIERHHACKVRTGANQDQENMPLGIYVDEKLGVAPDDERYGTYSTKEDMLTRAAKIYSPDMPDQKFKNLIRDLRSQAPVKDAITDPNISLFRNGVFNFETKELMPFSPDIVATYKFATRYPTTKPALPKIVQKDGSTWTPLELLPSMTSSKDIAKLLMQIVHAALRPNKAWNQMLWFFSTTGCNGKGTLCALLRNILGKHCVASLNMPDMSKDFKLATIADTCLVMADENPVGTFVEATDGLKAVVTDDDVLLNPKYRQPFAYCFRGLVVQCLNEIPRIRDRSASFLRRIILIPFDRSFLGHENKAIKGDYIQREDVLEWFVWTAMHMDDLDAFDEPDECLKMKSTFRELNNPVQDFFNEIELLLSWDLIPFPLLYELYKGWMAKNNPNGTILGRNTFIEEIISCANESGRWKSQRDTKFSSAGRMEGPEMCILAYDAQGWINEDARKSDRQGQCTLPPAKRLPQYRGIARIEPKNMNKDAQSVAFELKKDGDVFVETTTFCNILQSMGIDDASADEMLKDIQTLDQNSPDSDMQDKTRPTDE